MSTFDPDTLTLAAERDRIATEYDRVEAEIGEHRQAIDAADDDADVSQHRARLETLVPYLGDLDHMGRAVTALIDEHGDDATVRVRGLSAGEYAKVENKTADAADRASTSGGVPGSGRLIFAAAGLFDAPFYDGEPDALDAKLRALADQPVGVRKWVEDCVDERTVVGEKNWRERGGRTSDAASTT